ncbi:MAG TPA: hypothetical protein VGR24_07765 [bacterium]|jgi:hypothetical protein|nr:hypothetical protein [bacterium]
MPGFVVHLGSTVICFHGGQAQPLAPFPRVLVSGQPVVTLASPYAIAGCSLAAVPSPPCVTAQYVVGAVRVLAGGAPVLLQDSQAVCVPTGTGLTVIVTQPRVRGM